MDSLIIIIFICIAIPLLFSTVFLDKKARLFVVFMIMGAFICMFTSQLNGTLLSIFEFDIYYFTTNITPITEEVLKALPVLLFAYGICDKRKTLISVSMAIGIGFAIVENMFIFAQNDVGLSIFWAVKRVFGASLLHSICTAMVGFGISFIKKRKKLFYTGTFALLVTAIVYHSIYNSVIQSSFSEYGVLIPILTYVPIVFTKKIHKEKQK